MLFTRVKICGITRPEDAALAADLGAHAIGVNLFAGPRKIDGATASRILDALPTVVTPVALTACGLSEYANAPSIHEIAREYPSLATFQIYGDPPPELIERVPARSIWMVFSISSRQSIPAAAAQASLWNMKKGAILFDTAAEKLGGTGQSFNWHWIAEARDAGELDRLPPMILAGGLTPENVAEAIQIARPYAVDVSSGVEVAGKPGVKDPIKMRDFIQAAHSA
jgi:phosphoribosylanthranilate isomerase